MSGYKVGVGCSIVLFNEAGQFMLMKRTSKHGFGTYSTPGGWIEYMETFESAAERECMEELGVEIDKIKPIGLTNNFFPKEDKHTVTIVFGAKLAKGQEPKIMEPDKCESIAWYDNWDVLPQPIFTEYNKYVSKEDIANYLKWADRK
jgi:8-oxo-dGTP diphosphatase